VGSFVANLPQYLCANNYWNIMWFDEVIAKIKKGANFCPTVLYVAASLACQLLLFIVAAATFSYRFHYHSLHLLLHATAASVTTMVWLHSQHPTINIGIHATATYLSVCLSVCRCVCLSVCVCVWFTCLESSENLVDKELNVVVTQTLRFDDVVQISTHQVCHHVTTDHTDHWLLCHPVATDHTDHWSLPSGPCPTICIETGRFVCETLYSQVW